MHRETIYIYYHARLETRRYYDLGHYREGENEENWIIKWLLWHVFRYRDSRNRGRSTPSWNMDPLQDSATSSPSTSPNDISTLHASSEAHPSHNTNPVARQSYWDPVRDAQQTN